MLAWLLHLSFVNFCNLFPLEQSVSGYCLADIVIDLRLQLEDSLDSFDHSRWLVNLSTLLLALDVVLPFLLDLALLYLVDILCQVVHHFHNGLTLAFAQGILA